MQWLSVSEISQKTRIPAPTARRYASLFREYLPSRKIGRIIKYSEEAIVIFGKISSLYAEGHVTSEIEEILRDAYSRTIDVAPTSPAPSPQATILPVEMAEALRNMLDQFSSCLGVIADQKLMLEKQREEIKKLKTAFVLLAKGQKKIKQLPQLTQVADKEKLESFASKLEELEAKSMEREEKADNIAYNNADLKAKMGILETELIRLRKGGRDLEAHLMQKIEKLKG